ncbi:MAG: hypothetical protein LBC96_07870 [Lachnospiraceae bacterium]|jgi:hypothetical protein|nr:hypothetical protein [Lachnospiraceae bacterium]
MWYWEYTYPNAAEDYRRYSEALEKLKSYRRNINSYLTNNSSFNTLDFHDSFQKGEYYNLYSHKASEWVNDANKFADFFINFNMHLDNCIASTQARVSILNNQRNEKVWVEK